MSRHTTRPSSSTTTASATNAVQLLTNVSVWADTAHNRVYIDVTLHPSDGSKYRVYIAATTTTATSSGSAVPSPPSPPSSRSPRSSPSRSANNNISLLTLPKQMLETLTARLVLPCTHNVRNATTMTVHDTSAKERAKQTAHENSMTSMAPLLLVQIKLGGATLRPKSLLKKHTTLRKVLRAALVLGKSLWQQSRVDDAFDLMRHAVVRAIEVVPPKSDRNSIENGVLMDLFTIAKRAKLVGRRDPAMSVMLYRSTFSKCLLQLMGGSEKKKQQGNKGNKGNKEDTEDTEDKEDKAQQQRRDDTPIVEIDRELHQQNKERLHQGEQEKHVLLELKEQKMNRMTQQRKRMKEEERKRRQEERIQERKDKLLFKQEQEEQMEKDEDLWYTEGKKLEQIRIDLKKKERALKKQQLLLDRKRKREEALEKRKTVEAARVAAIEMKAKNRGQPRGRTDVGFRDGRN